MKYLVLLSCLIACSCSTIPSLPDDRNASGIQGTWELIDISAYTLMDSPPRGLAACKYHFSQDGRVYVINHDACLTKDTPSIPYTFKKPTLSLDIPEEGKIDVPVEFSSSNQIVLAYGERNRWTYRRLEGSKPFNKKIEPRSVAVIQTISPKDQLTNMDIAYDTQDYSRLQTGERIVGVWEATSFSGIPAPDCPPYGFPNDKWIFTDTGKHYRLTASETSLSGEQYISYTVSGNKLTMSIPDEKPITQTIGFNSWGHLELSGDGMTITLKLLSKNTNKLQKLPTKIALLKLSGE